MGGILKQSSQTSHPVRFQKMKIKKKVSMYESVEVACGALDASAEQMATFPPAR